MILLIEQSPFKPSQFTRFFIPFFSLDPLDRPVTESGQVLSLVIGEEAETDDLLTVT